MRWRLHLFFMALLAAFCMMLLTAVTDFNSDGVQHSPLVLAARSELSAPAGVLGSTAPARTAFELGAASVRRPEAKIRPAMPPLFVPRDADPVAERRVRESKANERGKGRRHSLLKLDEDGWYREETALITAYCPCAKCCGTQSPGITSIGKNAWTSGLAADPLYLEYGTRVYVPGYGLSVVDDTGGAMRRHWRRDGILHIDVRMTYHYEAKQWGKQYLRVKIYDGD